MNLTSLSDRLRRSYATLLRVAVLWRTCRTLVGRQCRRCRLWRGFPGIPDGDRCVPIAKLTLVESHQRKAVFLREACARSGECRVVLAERGEKVCSERYDWVVSRAVTSRSAGRLRSQLASESVCCRSGRRLRL